jgi:hypothetical protein
MNEKISKRIENLQNQIKVKEKEEEKKSKIEGSENLIIRNLEKNDYEKGYLNLLSQLTIVGEVNKEKFQGNK